MSERFKELVDDIKNALYHPDALDELLRLHAHQLAERQRAVADGWGADGYTAEADGLRQGADLIDPHTSAGPVRPGEETT